MRKAAFFLFAAAAAVLSVSCNKNEKIEPAVADPEFKPLSETTFNVDKTGGSFEFLYDIINPTEEDAVTAELEEGVDWITDLNAHSTFGKVTFRVLPNEENVARESSISLSYGSLGVELKVIQSEGEVIPAYQINIKEIDYMAVTWDVIAKEQEMPYINMIVDKESWDAYDSFEEFFKFSLITINQNAQSAGLTLEDYIEQSLIIYGDTLDVSTKGLLPATEYVIYAVGLTPEQEMQSEVCYQSFTTKDIPMVNVDFTITCETTPTSAVISVDPGDDEVYYMFSYVSGSGYTADEVKDSYQLYVNGIIEELLGYVSLPMEEIVEAMASQGPDSYNTNEDGDELTPSTTYTAFAVAVDLYTGIFNSEATLQEFTTDEMPQGDWYSTLTSDYTLNLEGAVGTVQYKPDYYRNGYDNWIVRVMSADGVSGDEIRLDFLSELGSLEAGIPSGEYKVASDSPDYRDPIGGEFIAGELFYESYLYTWYKGDFGADGKPQSVAPAMDGTLNVTNHGDGTYTIEFSFIDDSPMQNEFSGSWTGSLSIVD